MRKALRYAYLALAKGAPTGYVLDSPAVPLRTSRGSNLFQPSPMIQTAAITTAPHPARLALEETAKRLYGPDLPRDVAETLEDLRGAERGFLALAGYTASLFRNDGAGWIEEDGTGFRVSGADLS